MPELVMPFPYFEPWVGSNYGTNDDRLLILGESHYGPASMPGNSTKTLTQEYVDEKWNHRFWTNIMQVVNGQPHEEIDRAEFWRRVAFYNYVQQPVAETPGVAPACEMFTASKAAFFSVLDSLKPKAILVLSKRLWENLPSEGRPSQEIRCPDGSRESWVYAYNGGEALASWIPHPSYGFAWREWHPYVQALRSGSSNIPPLVDASQTSPARL